LEDDFMMEGNEANQLTNNVDCEDKNDQTKNKGIYKG
jgi:hypothetical protein